MDPLIVESFLAFYGVKSFLLITWSRAPESTTISVSFDVAKVGEETLLAGLGLRNPFDSQNMNLEYCKSSFKVHSKDLSSNVGVFGFR